MMQIDPRMISPTRSPLSFDIVAMRAEQQRLLKRTIERAPLISDTLAGPTAIAIGGRRFLVAELRLDDLAEMERWAREQVPHPMEGIPPAWADPEPGTRLARLAEARRVAATWPPRPGSAEYARLLYSGPGRAFFLAAVLRAGHPELTPAALADLAEAITPTEWAALERAAYALTPTDEIAAELVPEGPRPGPRWPALIHAAVERYGFTFEQVGRLTLSQWRCLGSGGKGAGADESFQHRSRRAAELLASVEKGG